ncbi:hypothetical protein Q765_06420 [Flavobacterium rivuli WB 3.3-2 = DSM 21788]|uniref:Outer membrane protein beta-barrel domain-containing protein n=1 Tax=Flavobacterium rivuli WB 3.3-2 = DSM 21788 TaxID=1121895 RepID=A0A0A2M3T6_9FLAO|nr:hypothetical protein [Flavobacterium rivuli]KGO87297.1 hypothetical protein Q765_06420 [Flavobacterium rivuli WB 3.3-2 = DSM 21788]
MRKKITKTALAAALLFSISCWSQEAATTNNTDKKTIKNVEAGFDGMLAVSYGTKAFGINVGGPSLKYKFTKNFKVGVGAFPSLLIMDRKAQPRLAVSPIVEYRNWMLITPYYGYNSKDRMIWTFGLGYKFI